MQKTTTKASCQYCNFSFISGSRRSFSNHYRWSPACFNQSITKSPSCYPSSTTSTVDEDNHCSIEHDDTIQNNSSTFTEDDESVYNFPKDCDTSLLEQFLAHERSGWGYILEDNKQYLAGIELLSLLRKTRSPLYIFDEIIKWVQKSILTYGMNFASCYGFTRNKTIKQIERRYDLRGLSPKCERIYLSGYKCYASVVFHDFKQCLYSLLTDSDLMKKDNLLLGPNDSLLYEPQPDMEVFDDINSGQCYRLAYKEYIHNSEKELLCPIIFFIDKTHTDTHGRLCLEPLQFTLGIFKREVRNMPKSWRSLGYVTDIMKNADSESGKRMQDYHQMLSILLRSFKKAQGSPIIWKFEIENMPKLTVSLKIPVMFIIGDTEGHDKLCGRYASRRNPPRLCRYCTVPFEESDDPFARFKYQKCKQIEELVENGWEQDLKAMSFHCVKNAWSDVKFCDSKRGIFGATLAELLHCLQQGIFEYGIKALYAQKKEKKGKRNHKNENEVKKGRREKSKSNNNCYKNKKRKFQVHNQNENEESKENDDKEEKESEEEEEDAEEEVKEDVDEEKYCIDDDDDDDDDSNGDREDEVEEEEQEDDEEEVEYEDEDEEDHDEDEEEVDGREDSIQLEVDEITDEVDDDENKDCEDKEECWNDKDEEIENDIPYRLDDEEEEIVQPQDEPQDESGKKNEKIEYSSHYLLPQKYCADFDNLCRKYGKYLQHQSDRQLPRTYFNSSYIRIAKKNAHEMAGILLVYLMIFSSYEGERNLISYLGAQGLADFTHCFELLLLLENFCKQTRLHRKDLNVMKRGMPLIMDFIKKTLKRHEGNGMKIVKFHLLLHFVDDVRRFGSMRNYDSCIGERHHCTEVKDPAQQTQRRKVNFEKQTALRYYDNLLISIGQREFQNYEIRPSLKLQYKNKNIIYDHRYKKLFKKESSKKLRPCHWKDKQFQESLTNMCNSLVETGKAKSPIMLFTQHNREELIFRANPEYDNNDPWYDWAYVDWGDEIPVPAKMLIFMDLSDNLLEPFQVGTSCVTEAGYYAIAYSCNTANHHIKTMDTLLVEKNQLIMEDYGTEPKPQLCMFNVESILSTCVAVPYDPQGTIISAKSWCFLRPRHDWQEQLINHLKKSLK